MIKIGKLYWCRKSLNLIEKMNWFYNNIWLKKSFKYNEKKNKKKTKKKKYKNEIKSQIIL